MKKMLFLTALCAMSLSFFAACGDDKPGVEEEVFGPANQGNQNNPGDPNNPGGKQDSTNQDTTNILKTFPDLFVYYPGAKFIYKRTVDTGLTEKITWTVTDYNEQTKTATVQRKTSGSEPDEIEIRSLSNGMIEFGEGGDFKAVVSDRGKVGYLYNYRPSIPSGIYGYLTDVYEVEDIAVPGGKSSAGVTVGANYDPIVGYHDSYLWDWKISESWCSECGFVRASHFSSNGKEYPITSSRINIEMLAYDIPMPDGTRRSFIPDGCETYDVTDTYCTYSHFTAPSQLYDALSFYWNDKKNQNVMRYNLYMLWYEDGWTYGPVVAGYEDNTQFSGWFKGKATSGSAIGGPRDSESFDCEGYYGTTIRSGIYFPEGNYVYFVMVENIVNEGTPTFDDTEFVLIVIDYENDYGSFRVKLLDDGTVDLWDDSSAQTRAGARHTAPVKVSKPDASILAGPARKLKP